MKGWQEVIEYNKREKKGGILSHYSNNEVAIFRSP